MYCTHRAVCIERDRERGLGGKIAVTLLSAVDPYTHSIHSEHGIEPPSLHLGSQTQSQSVIMQK